MKWKAISRKLGRKGYKGILGKEVGKNINSKAPNCDIQKELKEMCERMKFDPLETIIEIENFFVDVLEDYG